MPKNQNRKRVVYRIQLTLSAKDQLEDIGGRMGVPQSTLMARLLDWFCKQEKVTRALLLEMMPQPYASEVAQSVIEKMK